MKEQGTFFVVFKRSTQNYEFHNGLIIPLLFEYKDRDTAYKEAIRILEMEQLITEAVIVFSKGNNIPAHYGSLMSELERLYTETGRYKDALALTDKILTIADDINTQALVYNNKAYIYKLMGNKAAAISAAEKAISILENIKLQDSAVSDNCRDIIAEIKDKPQKSNLFEQTYFFE